MAPAVRGSEVILNCVVLQVDEGGGYSGIKISSDHSAALPPTFLDSSNCFTLMPASPGLVGDGAINTFGVS